MLTKRCKLFTAGLVLIGVGCAAIVLGQVMVLVDLLGR